MNVDGQLTEIMGTRAEDGATATLDTTGSTTTLAGSEVTIDIPGDVMSRVFTGTLSADENTMTGSVTEQINLGDLDIMLPGGDLTWTRVVDAPACDPACEEGQSCVEGECVVDAPAACDPECDEGQSCVEGECVDDGIEGDPVAGQAFYMANNCADCHGADAQGPPSLIVASADLIFDKLSGAVSHVGGTVEGVTEQDAADIAAWIASLS